MDPDTLELLRRSHEVFGPAGPPPQLAGTAGDQQEPDTSPSGGEAHRHYTGKHGEHNAVLRTAADRDAELRRILTEVTSAHEQAVRESKAVLDAATADHSPASDTPMGEREAGARQASYLRAQRDIIMRARTHAQQAADQLRALRYRSTDT